MFILKRQDVELSKIPHPNGDQQIPILTYQGQTYRLLKVFGSHEAEEAVAMWRDLIDNKGKVSVLLQEPERHSVWGKIRLDQLSGDDSSDQALPFGFTQGCFLITQAVAIDIEDLLGPKQAKSFEEELMERFRKWNLPYAGSPEMIHQLMTKDPLEDTTFPGTSWKEVELSNLLREVHDLGKEYFGNTRFTKGAMEVLEDLAPGDRQPFLEWLKRSGLAKLWQA